jgi:outer membrane lipoprotein SlyB
MPGEPSRSAGANGCAIYTLLPPAPINIDARFPILVAELPFSSTHPRRHDQARIMNLPRHAKPVLLFALCATLSLSGCVVPGNAPYANGWSAQPTYAQPANADSGYAQSTQPAYAQSGYAQPPQPTYAQPGYAQPPQPAYAQPGYAQPPQPPQADYEQPSDLPPGYAQQPGYPPQPADDNDNDGYQDPNPPQAGYNNGLQYGVVSAIQPLSNPGAVSTGGIAGTVVGAAVGGLIGNQFGHGHGRDAATVIGVLGGAVAGNQIGQQYGAAQPGGYRIAVQLNDGTSRSFDVSTPGDLRPGDRVRIAGNQLARY